MQKRGGKGDGVCAFITFVTGLQVTVKLAHWATDSYGRHVALDELHASLQDLGDRFVEAWMGRHGRPTSRCIGAIETRAVALKEDAIAPALRDAAGHLSSMQGLETDLASLRDDMVAALSKALYLLQLR